MTQRSKDIRFLFVILMIALTGWGYFYFRVYEAAKERAFHGCVLGRQEDVQWCYDQFVK